MTFILCLLLLMFFAFIRYSWLTLYVLFHHLTQGFSNFLHRESHHHLIFNSKLIQYTTKIVLTNRGGKKIQKYHNVNSIQKIHVIHEKEASLIYFLIWKKKLKNFASILGQRFAMYSLSSPSKSTSNYPVYLSLLLNLIRLDLWKSY